MNKKNVFLKTTYDITFCILAIIAVFLSIYDIRAGCKPWQLMVDEIITIIFIVDYFVRLFISRDNFSERMCWTWLQSFHSLPCLRFSGCLKSSGSQRLQRFWSSPGLEHTSVGYMIGFGSSLNWTDSSIWCLQVPSASWSAACRFILQKECRYPMGSGGASSQQQPLVMAIYLQVHLLAAS